MRKTLVVSAIVLAVGDFALLGAADGFVRALDPHTFATAWEFKMNKSPGLAC